MKTHSTALWGLWVSLCLHTAGLGVLFAVSADRILPTKKQPAVKIRLIKRAEKPIPESVPVKQNTPKPPLVMKTENLPVAKKPKPSRNKSRSRPKSVPEEKPKQPKPEVKPRRFTVSMNATVSSETVTVPTSSNERSQALGAPDGNPQSTKGLLTGDDVVDVAELTRLPRLLEQPSDEQMRAAYPQQARRDGIEGDVGLKILVSAKGRVEEVRVVRKAYHGFDELAVKSAEKFRFRPAERAGNPVAVWIPWTYKFRLGD